MFTEIVTQDRIVRRIKTHLQTALSLLNVMVLGQMVLGQMSTCLVRSAAGFSVGDVAVIGVH